MNELRKQLRKIKTIDEAAKFIKSEAIHLTAVDTVNLDNKNVMKAIGREKESTIIKSLKLYKTPTDAYMLVIYDYNESQFGKIDAISVGLFESRPLLPDVKNVMFQLNKICLKNAKVSKVWKSDKKEKVAV